MEQILAAALSGTRQTDDFVDVSLADVFKGLGNVQTGRSRAMTEAVSTPDGQPGRGILFSCLAPRQNRTSTVNDFSSGGAFVASDLGDYTKLAFNRSVLVASGAKVIGGQKANYLKPKITSAPTISAVSEVGATAASDILTAQAALKPCRLTAQVVISRQLAMRGGPAAEAAIRETITSALSQKLDYLGLNGQGANDEPLGIMNTPGIGSLLFGGAATWSKVVEPEKILAQANLDFSHQISWALSPLTKAAWKLIARNTATFLIEDERANFYPVLASNQLSDLNKAIFAAWDTVELIFWGNGIELLYDEYSKAAEGEILVTAVAFFNVLATYPQAIVVSADAANQ
jgi:hypothetical protein